MQLNLLVLRAHNPERLAGFYTGLGLRFTPEKHGSGPLHMACDTGHGIFEIYPCSEAHTHTRGVRIGFAVTDLDGHCRQVESGFGRLVRAPQVTEWGRTATIEDPEGHVIDLTEID
ncbi:hypothetical protein SAMN05428974_0588 [Sphingopyxis sp. YR583]|uniref:VOC family protein n=1 Tax=Sphingopyxis sp. YR583 TaxID=1881047 RepID=UPI0008A7D013|nr:VOC family protein [Sphingopyxis sp. YR583]SEH12890.1 hypothetical protein SAMN05428974_0588 [Sphingopyxis sp. YR583]